MTPPDPTADATSPMARWLRAFVPAPTSVDARERWRVVLGATLGILATAVLARAVGSPFGHVWPWLVPPLGASAVLVFGVPGSPLAQPWSVVGGNTVSALAGIACSAWLGNPMLAAPVAVGAAIGLMFALRCLHPPGGAAALVAALGGVTDPRFALDPVLLNSVMLVLAGIAYNTATRRPYPHPQARPAATPGANADLDTVIARYNQVLDISRDDLQALLEDAQLQGYQRRLADLRCAEIMSPRPVTVTPETTIAQAWRLFREHRIKALPVVGAGGAVVGIVTPADFMREAGDAHDDSHDERRRRMRSWSRAAPGVPVDTVARIMTRRVRVTSVGSHLSDLVPLFASTGHHHLPVVDEAQRLVGIITQSDVVAALVRSAKPERAESPA
ncbi:MAG: hypothetical protein ABT20_12345 [Rubrivivax sp. SCN 70-15]|nr:MAG: hypothetical protein ABT20_12345 [Rubrivivax sp. SCN 70-15]